MISVGGDLPVSRGVGPFDVSVKGDAGVIKMETGEGVPLSLFGFDDLDVSASRLRLGLEAVHRGISMALGGMKVSPFGSAMLRHDGGDGVTGTGFEVEGGISVSAAESRVGLEQRRPASWDRSCRTGF